METICSTRVVPDRGMPMISTGVASRAAEFGRPRDPFGCAAGNQAVDLDGERGRVERHRAPAHRVCGVEMLHGQGVVAKIVRRLADREVKPQALRRFQPRRGQAASIRCSRPSSALVTGDTGPDRSSFPPAAARSRWRVRSIRGPRRNGRTQRADCPAIIRHGVLGSSASVSRSTCSAS
jgi:hypothetical protein